MTVLLLSIVGGLIAFELWGSIDLVAKLAIRAITLPVPEPWKGIRRDELAALVHPCNGERRIVALLRVIAIAGALAISDIGHHRFRRIRSLELPLVWRIEDLFQDGMKSDERAPVAVLYLGAMLFLTACVLGFSAVAVVLGAALWQIALFWLLSPLAVIGLTLVPINASFRMLPIMVLAFAWAGMILTLALLRGTLLRASGRLIRPSKRGMRWRKKARPE